MSERTYVFTRWSGHNETVTATSIEFAPSGALVFHHDGRLVLAVKPGDWNNVHEVGDVREVGA